MLLVILGDLLPQPDQELTAYPHQEMTRLNTRTQPDRYSLVQQNQKTRFQKWKMTLHQNLNLGLPAGPDQCR